VQTSMLSWEPILVSKNPLSDTAIDTLLSLQRPSRHSIHDCDVFSVGATQHPSASYIHRSQISCQIICDADLTTGISTHSFITDVRRSVSALLGRMLKKEHM